MRILVLAFAASFAVDVTRPSFSKESRGDLAQLSVRLAIVDAVGHDTPPTVNSEVFGQHEHEMVAQLATRSPDRQTIHLTFPSGKTLTDEDYYFDFDRVNTFFSRYEPFEYDGKAGRRVLASHQRGRPHGPVLTSYSNYRPCKYVEYSAGDRHGLLVVWNEGGELAYWCKYVKGKPNEFCTLFEANRPRLVIEYEFGKAKAIHFIKSGERAETFAVEDAFLATEEARTAYGKLKAIQAEIDENEIAFRKELTENIELWRRDLAAVRSVASREAANARLNSRRANQSAMISGLHRASLGLD